MKLQYRDCHKQYYSLITRPWYLRNYMISQDIISDSAVLGTELAQLYQFRVYLKLDKRPDFLNFASSTKHPLEDWNRKVLQSLLLSGLALLKPLSWREKNCGLYWKIYWNLSIERGFRVSFPFRSGDISHKSKLQICEPLFTKSIGALGFPVNNRINQARKDTLPINQPKLTQDLVDHSSHHPSFPYQQPAQQHPVQLFGDDGGKV